MRTIGWTLQILAMIGGGLGYLVALFCVTVWWGLTGLVISVLFFPVEIFFPLIWLAQEGFNLLFLFFSAHWTGVFAFYLGGAVLRALAGDDIAAE